jgi:hypothetical protein
MFVLNARSGLRGRFFGILYRNGLIKRKRMERRKFIKGVAMGVTAAAINPGLLITETPAMNLFFDSPGGTISSIHELQKIISASAGVPEWVLFSNKEGSRKIEIIHSDRILTPHKEIEKK